MDCDLNVTSCVIEVINTKSFYYRQKHHTYDRRWAHFHYIHHSFHRFGLIQTKYLYFLKQQRRFLTHYIDNKHFKQKAVFPISFQL